jgi:hypothetical protein
MARLWRAIVATVLGALILGNVAFADATPVQLVLVYMPNVSNTGTTSASGIAELVMLEGEVRISAADLPRLEDEKKYVAWVLNTTTNQFRRLGAFNSAQSTGAVHFENVLPDAIPTDKHWNLLLITIEDNADAARPSNQHSIAGVFPRADNEPLPGVLPNTGGEPPAWSAVSCQLSACNWADWRLNSGLAALVFGLGGGAGYVLGRRRTTSARKPTADC